MSKPDVLPLCTTRSGVGGLEIDGVWCVPVHCMNCGKQHGYCNEAATQPGGGYVGYLCDLCAEKWSPVVGLSLIPDEVHWARAREAQQEDYGRALSAAEQVVELGDVNSALSRFVRGR